MALSNVAEFAENASVCGARKSAKEKTNFKNIRW